MANQDNAWATFQQAVASILPNIVPRETFSQAVYDVLTVQCATLETSFNAVKDVDALAQPLSDFFDGEFRQLCAAYRNIISDSPKPNDDSANDYSRSTLLMLRIGEVLNYIDEDGVFWDTIKKFGDYMADFLIYYKPDNDEAVWYFNHFPDFEVTVKKEWREQDIKDGISVSKETGETGETESTEPGYSYGEDKSDAEEERIAEEEHALLIAQDEQDEQEKQAAQFHDPGYYGDWSGGASGSGVVGGGSGVDGDDSDASSVA